MFENQSAATLLDMEEELLQLGNLIRSTYKTDQMLRRIQQKTHHTTWLLEDNFDPTAENNKFTTTNPERFYLANPSVSKQLYHKYVMVSIFFNFE